MIATEQEAKLKNCVSKQSENCAGSLCMGWVWHKNQPARYRQKAEQLIFEKSPGPNFDICSDEFTGEFWWVETDQSYSNRMIGFCGLVRNK